MNSSSDPAQPLPDPFPATGRLLALDYGTRRLGLALSNPERTIASPLENYTRRDLHQDARYLQRIVQEYRVAGIVIGLPVHMSGDEGQKSREARQFGQWVAEITSRPVRFFDERFSSAQAEAYLLDAALTKKQRKARLDMLAAQIILQTYLESGLQDQTPGAM